MFDINSLESACYDHATQIRFGVAEAAPHVMAYACLKAMFPKGLFAADSPPWRRAFAMRLYQRALHNADTVDPREVARRSSMRVVSMGESPEQLAVACAALPPLPMLPAGTTLESPADRRERLLATPPPHPSMLDLPDTREGRRLRRVAKQDYADWAHWTRSDRAVERGLVRAARAALAPVAPQRVALSWSDRVLCDLALLSRLGRPVPRASRHPLLLVPLHLRPHRRSWLDLAH